MFSKALRCRFVLRGSAIAAASSVLHCKASLAQEHQDARQVPEWSFNLKWYNDKGALQAPRWSGPSKRTGEPSYTRSQVALCDGSGKDGKLWVTYRDGVYDITSYVKIHPGGKFILSAAGGPVDSWWAYWMQHQISKDVADVLERLRIGHLSDWLEDDDEEQRGGGRWEDEQKAAGRSEKRQMAQSIAELPYESVTKCASLVSDYLTPTDALFVRNHAPVPAVEEEAAGDHAISVSVGSDEVASLSLDQLQSRFKSVKVTSVLQCTGNRAMDNISQNGHKTSGFSGKAPESIGLGMLGNVSWTGIRLSEVLRELVSPEVRAQWCEASDDLYVTFEGLDGYYNHTPLRHVMNPEKDCLLATHMNGAPLLPDHGYPLRVVLPGCPGARQVKWLSNISVGPRGDCDSPWFKHFYRSSPSLEPIQSLPLNSVILSPEPGDRITADHTTVPVRGVAYSGGTDQAVAAVEVSSDLGQTWQKARCLFEEVANDDSSKPRGWVRFEADLDLPHLWCSSCGGPLPEIWCRAFDKLGNVQPPRSEAQGGNIYNGYHRVPLVRR